MNERAYYVDDELMHSGVKGMKWHKHKYVTVKNGQYIYNHGQLVKDTKANAAEVADEADYYYNQARQGLNTAGNAVRKQAIRTAGGARNMYRDARGAVDRYADNAREDITTGARNTYNSAKNAYRVGVGKMTREGKRVKNTAQRTWASTKKSVGNAYEDVRSAAQRTANIKAFCGTIQNDSLQE